MIITIWKLNYRHSGSGCFEFKCILLRLMGLVCILNNLKKTFV